MAHSHIYDHRGDVVRTLHVEDPNDWLSGFTTTMEQEVQPVLEYAHALRDVQQNGANWRLIGVMPAVEAERMMRDGSFYDEAAIARYFADSDNARLRVWGNGA